MKFGAAESLKNEFASSEAGLTPLLPTTIVGSSRQTVSNTGMRKYQQLTLAIVAFVSFVAFIFYKHEYDRVRFVLEYMDTFGEPPPADGEAHQLDFFSTRSHVATPSAEWSMVTPDVSVYSSFWDDAGDGITGAKLRTVAIVETRAQLITPLNVKLWYESGAVATTSCEMETTRSDVTGLSTSFHVVFLTCTPEIGVSYKKEAPAFAQFSGNSLLSELRPVQETDSFKSVVDSSAVCVLPLDHVVTTLRIIEFISFYNILGFQKFVFYGSILTQSARKLLNKYSDDAGIVVEEKSFNLVPSLKALMINESSKVTLEHLIRQSVELDCQYRLRETHENVVVLRVDEFIIPSQSQSLLDVLRSLSGSRRTVVSRFHLSTQHVCVDEQHNDKQVTSRLLLGHRTHSRRGLLPDGTDILRPHLLTSAVAQAGLRVVEQHVSPASMVVYRIESCSEQERHSESTHLPTRFNYASLVEKSILYRKWKVFYE